MHYSLEIYYINCLLLLFPEFEQSKNLPDGLILKTILADRTTGAWTRLEEGKLNLTEFTKVFSDECSQQVWSVTTTAMLYYKYIMCQVYKICRMNFLPWRSKVMVQSSFLCICMTIYLWLNFINVHSCLQAGCVLWLMLFIIVLVLFMCCMVIHLLF